MLKISLETIKHKDHRYATVGDYWENKSGERYIKASEMKNRDYELLVFIHEVIEQHLCIKHGISEKSITTFDIAFEERRKKGLVSMSAEPGDDINAPYHKEHVFANNIERLVAFVLGVNWDAYNDKVMSL